METVINAIKGFNKDMTCTPTSDIKFQYKEGEEYEERNIKACKRGYHGCEYPLDVLKYYAPNKSVYHRVEMSGDIDRSEGDKICASKIKIGAEISIAGLAKAAIEYTRERAKKEKKSDDDFGASSATGDCGASSATGYKGASSATGDLGASSATGYKGASCATGDFGASSATGNCGASSATGYKGESIAGDSESVAVAWGYKSMAKGVLGSFLVLADWEGNKDHYWKQEEWSLKGAKMVQVDGETIKADTWYTMENGEVIEVEEKDV